MIHHVHDLAPLLAATPESPHRIAGFDPLPDVGSVVEIAATGRSDEPSPFLVVGHGEINSPGGPMRCIIVVPGDGQLDARGARVPVPAPDEPGPNEMPTRREVKCVVFERPARAWDENGYGGRAQRLRIDHSGTMALEEWYETHDPPSWQRATAGPLPRWDIATGDRELALWTLLQDLATGRVSWPQ